MLLATVIFLVVIAVVGISSVGEIAFRGSPTMDVANSTMWSAYAMGGNTFVVFLVLVVAVTLLAIAVGILKTEKKVGVET